MVDYIASTKDFNPELFSMLKFDEMNLELRENEEKQMKLIFLMSEQKIENATGNTVISQLQTRHKYLQDLIDRMTRTQSKETSNCQTSEETNSGIDKALQSDSGTTSTSSLANSMIVTESSSNPTISPDNAFVSNDRPSVIKANRIQQRNSVDKYSSRMWSKRVTWKELQAKSFTKVVAVIDHNRYNSKTLMKVIVLKDKSPRIHLVFVMTALDTYDANKYLMKEYVDSVEGVRAKNIQKGRFKLLRYIRAHNIEDIDRIDLVELEHLETARLKLTNRSSIQSRASFEAPVDVTDSETDIDTDYESDINTS